MDNVIITSTGESEKVFLGNGRYKVWVEVNGSISAIPKLGKNQTSGVAFALPDGTTTISESKVFDVTGPGYLFLDVSTISGTTVLSVQRV